MIERHRLATGREHDWEGVITEHASHVEYQIKTGREPPMMNGPADQSSVALDAVRQGNVAVRDERWATPPPWPQWNIGGLVIHVVAGNCQLAVILRCAPPSSYHVGPGADLLSVHRDSASSLYQRGARVSRIQQARRHFRLRDVRSHHGSQ
jgi:hypothetical protein